MCYPVCGKVHNNEPLLLIENNNTCSDSVSNGNAFADVQPISKNIDWFSAQYKSCGCRSCEPSIRNGLK